MKKRIFQVIVLVLVFALFGSAFAYAATKNSTTYTKKTVTINWANPQDITYGTKLSSTQLNASATYNGTAVYGTYTYSPGTGTVLSPGSQQTLKVTFTPSNKRVYNTAYKEVKINVLDSTKATPSITWAAPADITAGTALSSTQLNAAATYNGTAVAGTYSYSPAAGTVLSAGASQILKVTFIPTDAVKYSSAYFEVKINVLNPVKVTPVINWATPADITAGTALSSTQLKAAATYNGTAVAGTYSYSPAAGTVLSAGASQILKVTFTPTDAVAYNSAYKEVKINVLAPATSTPTTVPADALNVKTQYGAKGDGITDDTASINNAILAAYSKGGGTVYIPDGTYLVNPLTKISLKSNVKLMLSNNAILKSKATSSESYNIINIWQASNVSITGGKIIGDKAIHTGTTGQWGFGISMYGCKDVYIADITISDCWGDGIYIGSAVNAVAPSVMYCENVTIERAYIYNSRRSNISVISAKNLTIKDCILNNANGNCPEAGLNFEPNYSNEFVQNVVIENLLTNYNKGYGLQLGYTMRNLTNPVDITIINHKDIGSLTPIGPWPLGTFETNHVVIK